MIVQLEKDLEGIVKAIEQAIANLNTLHGQKQGLEHALTKIKEAASVTETIVDAVESVTQPTQGE